MKNTKLRHVDLCQGYIQQYIVGTFRITLEKTGEQYCVGMQNRITYGMLNCESVFIIGLVKARHEFTRLLDVAKEKTEIK